MIASPSDTRLRLTPASAWDNKLLIWVAVICCVFVNGRFCEAQEPGDAPLAPRQGGRVAELLKVLGNVDPDFAKLILSELETAKVKPGRTHLGTEREVLDSHCLAEVAISPESRVKVDAGRAPCTLIAGSWTYFLIKVNNDASVSAPLHALSAQFADAGPNSAKNPSEARWLEFEMVHPKPLSRTLTGEDVEYRLARLRTRQVGKRSAIIAFDVGQGTGDIGFRGDCLLTFVCKVEGTMNSKATKPEHPLFEEADERPSFGGANTTTEILGQVFDNETHAPIPARLSICGEDGKLYLVSSPTGNAVTYRREKPQFPDSAEVHTSLSAHPFAVRLKPGTYKFRVERGKEYEPIERQVTVGNQKLQLEFQLQRWANMAERGWYSGDVHVHRSVAELPVAILAEDLNVALPVNYWVVESGIVPSRTRPSTDTSQQGLIEVDATHAIYNLNTEYEVFRVAGREHTLGALLVLNHQQPLQRGVPPLSPLAEEARQQGALLDLEKHSWPWSLMLVPVLDIDLFELANNHLWQTDFGLKSWTVDTAPAYMNLERDADGFTEWGWIDYGFQSYYALVNCGFRLRVSAGTASGVHPVPLGFGRVYVHLPEGFSYAAWIAGLNAGNSFVTTGPLLDVRFNQLPPGSKFQFAAGERGRLRVSGVAESSHPLDRIELIVNGRIHTVLQPRNLPGRNGGFSSAIEATIEDSSSFWVAIRCFEKHPNGRIRFAHSNPAYADIDGRPLIPRNVEIDYLTGRIEEEIAANIGSLPADALAEYRRALGIYQKIGSRRDD